MKCRICSKDVYFAKHYEIINEKEICNSCIKEHNIDPNNITSEISELINNSEVINEKFEKKNWLPVSIRIVAVLILIENIFNFDRNYYYSEVRISIFSIVLNFLLVFAISYILQYLSEIRDHFLSGTQNE